MLHCTEMYSCEGAFKVVLLSTNVLLGRWKPKFAVILTNGPDHFEFHIFSFEYLGLFF